MINNLILPLISKSACIYRLLWNNGYFYIGQASCVRQRFRQHKYSSTKIDSKLYNVWRKYGEPNLEVIKYCSLEELNINEQKYIDQYIKNILCCNTSPTAESNRGIKWAKSSPKKNKPMSMEQRKKLSISHLGKHSGENGSGHKLTNSQVIAIREEFSKSLIRMTPFAEEKAWELNVSKDTVWRILKGHTWKNLLQNCNF